MRIQAIGSLYKHVADIDPQHERPIIKRQMRWSEELKAERKRLFGGRGVKPRNLAGRFVEPAVVKRYFIKAEKHQAEIEILKGLGLDFTELKPSGEVRDVVNKMKYYVETKIGMSIHEAVMRKNTQEKYYFTALVLMFRYTYNQTTRDTAWMLDIDLEPLKNAVHNTREKKFTTGNVLQCMKELYEVMR